MSKKTEQQNTAQSRSLQKTDADFHVVSDASNYSLDSALNSSSSSSRIFEQSRKRTGYRFIKRVFDLVFSFCVCVILCIPVTILAIVISIDTPGFPIFTQERLGRYGKPIKVLKLRTMYDDAQEHPDYYFTDEQMKTWKRELKVENDPRVTRIGHFLRRTSLDEIPQFLNVLIGQMSVIGCRPITREELNNFTDEEKVLFLSQKMGITGWWQVTDRNNATWEDGSRQAIELYYVTNASIRLDLSIFARTFLAIFCRTGQ